MISAIYDVISGIANFFSTVFDFLVFVATEIREVFSLAFGALSYMIQFLGVFPSALSAAFIACITVIFIYKLKE